MCVQVFPSCWLFFLLPLPLLLVAKQIRKFTALVQTHTHTHMQTVAIECNFAWYIKKFFALPSLLWFFSLAFLLLFSPVFLVAFWVPIVCNISAVGAWLSASLPASLPALFILLCAHYARPATITMKTVFNEIFEQVSRTHTGRPRGRARERGGHVFCTYAEKYAAINCSSSSGRHLVF